MKDSALTSTLISLILLFSGKSFADEIPLEAKIKAGYLYNFTKFVSWPDFKGPTFNLCIIDGSESFIDAIKPIEEKLAFDKPIKVISLEGSSTLSNVHTLDSCQIAYINNSNERKSLLASLNPKGKNLQILVVSENDGSITSNEMIAFVTKSDKIKLRINMLSVKQSSIKISAKLLEIADLVKEEK